MMSENILPAGLAAVFRHDAVVFARNLPLKKTMPA